MTACRLCEIKICMACWTSIVKDAEAELLAFSKGTEWLRDFFLRPPNQCCICCESCRLWTHNSPLLNLHPSDAALQHHLTGKVHRRIWFSLWRKFTITRKHRVQHGDCYSNLRPLGSHLDAGKGLIDRGGSLQSGRCYIPWSIQCN